MLRAALNRLQVFVPAALLCAALVGCPPDETQPIDAGVIVDSGPPPVACDSPEDCRAASAPGVCRQGFCRTAVPCTDDVECGLGETCENGNCQFTGCASDDDCPNGLCRIESFSCTECRQNADCPEDRPVCTSRGRCLKCQQDSDCSYPDSPYCDTGSGQCVYCKTDQHCPTGLKCGGGGVCVGAQKNAACSENVACDLGLMCVIVGGGNQICLEACNLYNPTCPTGEICGKLTFSNTASLVFEGGAPLGVCFASAGGAGWRDLCDDNCRGNLMCIPTNAADSHCRAFCDPVAPFCPGGEICHSFPGDYLGHYYGLCYADNGYADPCTADRDCRSGQVCLPEDDPVASFNGFETYCSFARTGAPALSPCTRDSDCASGACRTDGVIPGFCFSACDEDLDCDFGDRTGLCGTPFYFPMFDPGPGGNRSDSRGRLDFTDATVIGCRPSCDSPATCAEYASGLVCVASLDFKDGSLVQTCSDRVFGSKRVGEPCASDSECFDGFCSNRDGRGTRKGVCSHPCATAVDCSAPALSDGGAPASPACGDVVYWLGPGNDGAPNTTDDPLGAGTMCGGGACTTPADCSGAWSACVPDRDPANPSGNYVTACRAPGFGSVAPGGACASDVDCQSGVCGVVASSGGRACLQLCTPGGTDCGALNCVAGGITLPRPDGTQQAFAACLQ